MVRQEVRAGRLRWTSKDVFSLIQPYPKRKEDAVLERLGELHQLDLNENEVAWEDASADADSGCESMASTQTAQWRKSKSVVTETWASPSP